MFTPDPQAACALGSAGFLSTPLLSVCTSEAAFVYLYPHRQLYVGPTMKITAYCTTKQVTVFEGYFRTTERNDMCRWPDYAM
jgi:hypothetical protein